MTRRGIDYTHTKKIQKLKDEPEHGQGWMIKDRKKPYGRDLKSKTCTVFFVGPSKKNPVLRFGKRTWQWTKESFLFHTQ